MRISDWSSDVCSSDLSLAQELSSVERLVNIRGIEEKEGRVLPLALKRANAGLGAARYRLRNLETSLAAAQSTLAFVLGLPAGVQEIGRASWRERVCEYV